MMRIVRRRSPNYPTILQGAGSMPKPVTSICVDITINHTDETSGEAYSGEYVAALLIGYCFTGIANSPQG